MARVDVEQHEVLQAVVDYLRTDLTLDDRQCYLTVDPRHFSIPMGGDYWLCVSPGEGQFDDALFTGGGEKQLTEDATFAVTGYSRVFLDDANRDVQLLTLASRGLLRIKRKILKSLAGKDLQSGDDTFGRQLCTPTFAHRPEVGYVTEGDDAIGVTFVTIEFAMPFDWDLTDT